ncbi:MULTISPECIES: adenylate/guanylate cyclase domain-containing protein [unclassified Leptolyngbya]|uniref:adenylate/guanylate cyclase domain-containing protein n=1 Tax=unclassified Leptolyngbya TaxID=2650499 RepID=UPI001684EF21|nr:MULTISPECIES: adenylate/guanylate cyclase domain-containing protein [unclassified Leptolyngbya]MBD1910970.1 adenylate/guanylate cyclase domain-containing protein [Leptolyngbya sp. FACHB-8]MBD2158363.1 adenylate/guanylate cyclase domain-containing protein [Leptolyngbya sp. FACHB-16]
MTRLPVSEHAVLAEIEPQMRRLLPADLYARVWFDPEPDRLMQVFQHLRTLQRALQDYVPRQVAEQPPPSGKVRYEWRQGTLLFTDLAGFTPLMEANAASGRKGAMALLEVLNRYFSEMIEIIGKSGGDLLEFTGDAMLVQFLEDVQGDDTAQAVRTGLRMQRAMRNFRSIETPQGRFSLAMRVGIHAGMYLAADLGTPHRMAHVLLGQTVQRAKLAESSGKVGRVCVTQEAGDRLRADDQFDMEPCQNERQPSCHYLIQDDLTTGFLGDYDISLNRRRLTSPLLLDRSTEGLLNEIQDALRRVQLLACYLPSEILTQLVEGAAERRIPPNFPEPTVVFINLMGYPEAADIAHPDEVPALTESFSRTFSLIDAAVKARGGTLQKVTYHAVGSDILIYFGAFSSHPEDALRAAGLALAVQEIVQQLPPPIAGGVPVSLGLRVGICSGAVFSAEIGEPRGRREFNILGDPVNTAARLMARAQVGDILLTERVYQAIAPHFYCEPLGAQVLKGKAQPQMLYALKRQVER